MKKNFKLVSLLTIFTVVLNVLSVLVLMRPATALSDVTVGSTSQTAGETATYTDNFTITGTSAVITIPEGYTGTVGTITPGGCTNDAYVITCEGLAPGFQEVVIPGLVNPSAGTYTFIVDADETTVEVDFVIVDSYEVDVNGYINSSLTFDIDTDTDGYPCAFDECQIHGGEGTALGSNYTVDLGNLTTGVVNRSGGTVLHSDGITGGINYIWFSLSTNAQDGAIVQVLSEHGFLDGPTGDIAATTTLEVGHEGYGIGITSVGEATDGTIASDCVVTETDGVYSNYCQLDEATPATLFNSSGLPVEGARVQAEVGATISALTNPGTYLDTLTFVATSTF